jgi:uncharacterized membrane protein
MNPFDLRAALLAKHAQHPVIIHFPIALFITSLAFDFLAIWRKNPALATVAYYNLLAAAGTAAVAIASGLTAWQWQLEGARLKGNLLLHLIFALSASGIGCSAGGGFDNRELRNSRREGFTSPWRSERLC